MDKQEYTAKVVREQGKQAYINNVSWFNCPYDLNDPLAKIWRDAWDDERNEDLMRSMGC